MITTDIYHRLSSWQVSVKGNRYIIPVRWAPLLSLFSIWETVTERLRSLPWGSTCLTLKPGLHTIRTSSTCRAQSAGYHHALISASAWALCVGVQPPLFETISWLKAYGVPGTKWGAFLPAQVDCSLIKLSFVSFRFQMLKGVDMWKKQRCKQGEFCPARKGCSLAVLWAVWKQVPPPGSTSRQGAGIWSPRWLG